MINIIMINITKIQYNNNNNNNKEIVIVILKV